MTMKQGSECQQRGRGSARGVPCKENVVRPLKSNLVLLHNGDNQAIVIELTCSTNTKSNLAAAHSRKQNKEAYGILFSDSLGWLCFHHLRPTKGNQHSAT